MCTRGAVCTGGTVCTGEGGAVLAALAAGEARGVRSTGPAGSARGTVSTGASRSTGTTRSTWASRSTGETGTALTAGITRAALATLPARTAAVTRTIGRAGTAGRTRTAGGTRAARTRRPAGTTRTTGRRQRSVAGGRPAGRPRGPALTARPALATGGEVRKPVTPLLAATLARVVRRIRRPGRSGTQRPRRQRSGHVEGTGTAAVTGRHRPGTARAGQPRAIRTVRTVRAAGPSRTTGSGALGRTGTGRPCAGAANSRPGTRPRARCARTPGHPGAVGVATARAALGRAGLARREPVARLVLGGRGGHGVGPGVGVHGPARTGTRPGLRGDRRGRTRTVGGLAAPDGRAHDDRRNGPGSGDVDADPGRQRGLGLGLLRPVTGGTPRVSTVVGSHGRSVRRSPRRVCGSSAPVGPGGRTVSFTAQGRFSRLAPPPVYSTSIRAARRRAPPYWPLVARILRPSGKPTPDLHLRAAAKWYVTCQVGRRGRPVAALVQGWRTSQPQPSHRAGRGRSPLLRRRGSRPPGGWL